MGAGGCEGRGGDAIVAGGLDQTKAAQPLFYRLSVARDLFNGRLAALLDAAQRLLLEGGDAAVLVARRGILVDGLVVAAEVVFELVNHTDGSGMRGGLITAIEERSLGTKHLRHFGEHDRAAP